MKNFETLEPTTADSNDLESRVEEKFRELMDLPIVQRGFGFIKTGLEKKYPELAKEFPEEVLPYHGPEHTNDVFHEALRLGISEGISNRDLELLAIAATRHDAGFVEKYEANEEIGAEIAAKDMEESGLYSAEEILRVKNAILSTRVSFKPKFHQEIEGDDILGKILADADLGNFGREDFRDGSNRVFRELVVMGKMKNTKEGRQGFDNATRNMITSHEWQTESARELRLEQEKKNIKSL